MSKFHVGDKVRYVGDDPNIPAGQEGDVLAVDLYFPGSVQVQIAPDLGMNVVDSELALIVNGEIVEPDVIELDSPIDDDLGMFLAALLGVPLNPGSAAAAPVTDLVEGDRVRLLQNESPVVFAELGQEGTVIKAPYSPFPGSQFTALVEFYDIDTDENYTQGVARHQVETIVDAPAEALSAPETDAEVEVGTRVRVTGFAPDLNGSEGTVIEVPGDVADMDYFTIDIPGRKPFVGDGWLMEREEFEVISEAVQGDIEVVTDAPKGLDDPFIAELVNGDPVLAEFELLARRFVYGAKAAGEGTPLAALLLDMAFGFALDNTESGKAVIRELIGKGEAG